MNTPASLRGPSVGLAKSLFAYALLVIAAGVTAARADGPRQSAPTPSLRAKPDSASRTRLLDTYGRLPLSFEVNRGQTDASVDFISRAAGRSLFLARNGALFVTPQSRLTMRFEDANPDARVDGREPLDGTVNYFIGHDPANWHTAVPTYAKVGYRDLYPGIDLVYYGNQRQLEYDFIVAPGADPKAIGLSFGGIQRMRIDGGTGDLVLRTGAEEMRLRKPVVYQLDADGGGAPRKHFVDARYRTSGGKVAFELAPYDTRLPLIIDPVVAYSTYLGGTDVDVAYALAVDREGNAYVAGENFPDIPPLVVQKTLAAAGKAAPQIQPDFPAQILTIVIKLNPAGTALRYSAYIGSTAVKDSAPLNYGLGIAVDAAGDAYVTGGTFSSDFPTTPGAFQRTYGGGEGNAYVFKLNAAGTKLLYSTFLGGNNYDYGNAIAIDAAGHAYVTGYTTSTDFPTTPGALSGTLLGSSSAFVTKLDPAGRHLVYSTFIEGSDQGNGIALDQGGHAYVTGSTSSTSFPTTPGAFQTVSAGNGDAFVLKLNDAGSALLYSSFLGGSEYDAGGAIAVDRQGNAYVTGGTTSTDFPTTAGAFQRIAPGSSPAFVTKLTIGHNGPAGVAYSTYLGGNGFENGSGIAVDSHGSAYVTGSTASTNFPITSGAFRTTYGGGYSDGFATELNASGRHLLYSTYLGGNDNDSGNGIAVDEDGGFYVGGQTLSADFPTTAGALQTTLESSNGVFVTKFGKKEHEHDEPAEDDGSESQPVR